MPLEFLVIEGPLKNHRFQLKAGQVIGRLNGDIVLQDPKASGKHARIDMDQGEELILVDLGSANGIKINNRKVSTVILSPGLRLQLGSSLLEVIDRKEKQPLQHSIEDELKPEIKQPQWSEIIYNLLTSKGHKIKDHPKVVAPFIPPVVLTFIRGLQFESKWVIGYGPRKIGSKSVDFPIFEPQAPDICFKILPSPQGPEFSTSNSDIVLLNETSTSAATLKSGDLISIFDSLIEVSFDEKNT